MNVANRLFLQRRRTRGGYSLIEVVVAMAILLIGVVGVLKFFPPSLRASSEAALRGDAALLAQMKVEEMRRDADKAGTLVEAIKLLTVPTDPVAFPEEPRLAYQFCGRSTFSLTADQPGDVEDDFGVARVIVRYNRQFRPSGDVLVELRFDR